MGDFYELFFEDAEIASRALGIVLTKRGRRQGASTSRCAACRWSGRTDYLHRLIALGHRVAEVPEQLGKPRRGAGTRPTSERGPRAFVRLVTPGHADRHRPARCRTNDSLLAIAHTPRWSSSVGHRARRDRSSNSEFIVTECSTGKLPPTLARINSNEVVSHRRALLRPDLGPGFLRELPRRWRGLTRDVFSSTAPAERRLCVLRGWPPSTPSARCRGSKGHRRRPAAVAYIDRTQVGERPPLSPPSREAAGTAWRSIHDQRHLRA